MTANNIAQRNGGQFIRAFAAAGTCDYVYNLHTGMTGSISVP